jgi:uncharacterized protein (TIGR03437 family)
VVVAIQPNVSGLAAGVYPATIRLAFSDGTTRALNLLLVLAPPAGCQPRRLLPVFTQLAGNFAAAVGWPTAVEAVVVDDCGGPFNRGPVTATFSNGDRSLGLSPTGAGRWAGTWVPRNPSPFGVAVTVRAQDPANRFEAAVQVSGAVARNPDVPLVSAGGVTSAASYQPFPGPGTLLSVFGAAMAHGLAGATSLPLQTTLGTTTVNLGGRLLPLLFASETQINAVMPYERLTRIVSQVVVRRGNALSVPESLVLSEALPAVFTVDQSGRGQGHIYRVTNEGARILASPGSPASAGDVLEIYCTGLGPVDRTLNAAEPVPAELLRTVYPVSVTIGDRPARVLFAGLTAGFVGLYQVNAVMPELVSTGDRVPIVISVGAESSPPVTIAAR